jgi:hypothetical protein
MREDYTNLHVYAFDYNLGLSVIETLKSIYKVKNDPPILVVNNKIQYGFKTQEELEALMPGLSTSTPMTATTTTEEGTR